MKEWAVIALTVAFLLAMLVSWVRERRSGMWLERATLAMLVVSVTGGFFALDGESRERRDQICRSAEREHLAGVTRLQRTYDYLTRLDPQERRETLNRFVVRSLPRIEEEARNDVAPEFCDEDGIGLPEPDPCVPRRPVGLAFVEELPPVAPPPPCKR